MIFGDLPVAEAAGAVLAHSQQVGDRHWKKGTRLTQSDVATLQAAGVETVVAARLDAEDLDENAGAERVARACAGDGIDLGPAATGRVNLFAAADGLAVYDRERLHAVNTVDEAITIAAVGPYDRVETGQLIATVKIIPLGLPAARCDDAARRARPGGAPLIGVAPFQPRRAGLLQTLLPGTRDKVVEKTTTAIRERMQGLRGTLHASTFAAREIARQVDKRRHRVGQVRSLSCAGAEYVRLARGELDFSLFTKLMPWDHAPGTLIYTEAGGHVRLLDGAPYRPTARHGSGLLMAPDAASWRALYDTLFGDA